MIYAYSFGFKKIKVWMGEVPEEANFIGSTFISRSLDRSNKDNTGLLESHRKSAIEVLLPSGPMGAYGLIGGEFIPDLSSQNIDITLSVLDDSQTPYSKSIALKSDRVTVGLPEYFSLGVISVAEQTVQNSLSFPAGQLILNCAATGIVGSNLFIFKMATVMLIRVLGCVEEGCVDSSIKRIIESELSSFSLMLAQANQ